MTTTLNATDPDDLCTSCAARAGSCEVRTWLSGRACCDTCAGPHTHRGAGGVHLVHLDHDGDDRDLIHLDHLEHDQQGGHQ